MATDELGESSFQVINWKILLLEFRRLVCREFGRYFGHDWSFVFARICTPMWLHQIHTRYLENSQGDLKVNLLVASDESYIKQTNSN